MCPARGEAEFLNVIFAVARRRRHHDFGDEIDDGRGRLFGFEFSKDVALVIRLASRFTSDKSEATTMKENRTGSLYKHAKKKKNRKT